MQSRHSKELFVLFSSCLSFSEFSFFLFSFFFKWISLLTNPLDQALIRIIEGVLLMVASKAAHWTAIWLVWIQSKSLARALCGCGHTVPKRVWSSVEMVPNFFRLVWFLSPSWNPNRLKFTQLQCSVVILTLFPTVFIEFLLVISNTAILEVYGMPEVKCRLHCCVDWVMKRIF